MTRGRKIKDLICVSRGISRLHTSLTTQLSMTKSPNPISLRLIVNAYIYIHSSVCLRGLLYWRFPAVDLDLCADRLKCGPCSCRIAEASSNRNSPPPDSPRLGESRGEAAPPWFAPRFGEEAWNCAMRRRGRRGGSGCWRGGALGFLPSWRWIWMSTWWRWRSRSASVSRSRLTGKCSCMRSRKG